MKALTLWQPWASLIVLGHKRFETRSWKQERLIGERIAIHAAKRPPKDLSGDLLREFDKLGIDTSLLPFGAVLGTAVVAGFQATELISPNLTRRELGFGNYASGRWAWRLDDVEMLPAPEAARGRQGIWNWTSVQFPETVQEISGTTPSGAVL